jgi:hypothetical protein
MLRAMHYPKCIRLRKVAIIIPLPLRGLCFSTTSPGSDAELIVDRLQRSAGSMAVTQLRVLGEADGKVICFFQAASKLGVRYATFGFQPDAKLDDGNMWAGFLCAGQIDRR